EKSIFAGFPITFRNNENCTAAFIGNKQEPDEVYEDDGSDQLNLIRTAYEIMFELGYVFVTSILADWNNIPYTRVIILEELYPVTSYLTLNFKGEEVCAYGVKSGFFCGTLDEIIASIKFLILRLIPLTF
ncbi:11811_t:CDS:2, partial [Gigaspora rosea]